MFVGRLLVAIDLRHRHRVRAHVEIGQSRVAPVALLRLRFSLWDAEPMVTNAPGGCALQARLFHRRFVMRDATMMLSDGRTLACGALLADRVVGVGVANGVTDMGWPPAWDGYDPP